MLKKLGPGILVTAAFIGPGTITTASAAGANFGLALLWTLLFSVVATIVLQEMAARLGLVSGAGLADALRVSFHGPTRVLVIALILIAIAFGNAAYQAGNVIGASMGLETVFGLNRSLWCIVVGVLAFGLLSIGVYRLIEKVLIVLVLLMSLVFITTMVLVKPEVTAILSGLVTPAIPSGSVLTIVALIGTTVVPYNLFLHSSSVAEKWDKSVPLTRALKESRADTAISVSIGGFITMAIVITAAAAFFGTGAKFSAENMALQLEPVLGAGAKYFFAAGMLAAGISSAVTAPLAGAYATSGALGWPRDLADKRFRAIWAAILVAGTLAAASGGSPVQAILFAQASNGILLPVSAIFLLVVMNRESLLGEHRNRLAANIFGGIVVAVATGLGGLKLLQVSGLL